MQWLVYWFCILIISLFVYFNFQEKRLDHHVLPWPLILHPLLVWQPIQTKCRYVLSSLMTDSTLTFKTSKYHIWNVCVSCFHFHLFVRSIEIRGFKLITWISSVFNTCRSAHVYLISSYRLILGGLHTKSLLSRNTIQSIRRLGRDVN